MSRKLLYGIVCLLSLLPMLAQIVPRGTAAIDRAISEKKYATADSLVKSVMSSLVATGNFDSLVTYIPISGKITSELYGAAKASAAVFAQIDFLESKNAPAKTLVDASRAAADFFSSTGRNMDGYKASELALRYTLRDPSHTDLDIAHCEYNLGTYAYRLADIALAKNYLLHSLQLRLANKQASAEDLYMSYNSVGSLFWNASKYDSATLFFNNALEALKRMPQDGVNKFYRPGNIQNNLAAVYSAEGKTTDAIHAMEATINDFQQFIASKDVSSKKQSATEGLFEAIDNLAGIYKEIGDYGKAGDLLRYSYQQKQQRLNADHPGIFISEILLGQHYHAIHGYDSAAHYLESGLRKLGNTEGDYLFWAADANYTLAMIAEYRKDFTRADTLYKKSENLYEASYGGEYDNVYMDFLRSASLFYATQGDYAKAIERANKVYDYLVGVGQGNSIQAFYQLLNIADINYLTKRYRQAIASADNALTTINAKMKAGITLLDSVKMEVFKPRAILISARSEYELANRKDTILLNRLAGRLRNALALLEKRKVLIDDESSIDILISDNQELIDFAKKIELQLYRLTGHASHLEQFINLHEAAVYNRIRSRIDKQNAVHFSNLPLAVQEEEQRLRKAIGAALIGNKPANLMMQDYLQAEDRWEKHLGKLKIDYPVYYNMRYATIFEPLDDIQHSIADSSTVIRYFIVDSSLLALVVDRQHENLVTLDAVGLNDSVGHLLSTDLDETQTLTALHALYTRLWQPLQPYIHNTKLTIIPDGILYDLSFEMLATKPLQNYRGLMTNSLLSQYAISYHYSLFSLHPSAAAHEVKDNYVAFAPGFSDKIKSKYVTSLRDSVSLDHAYLQLLPQPNTNRLAKKIKGLIGGDLFLEENSTEESFRQHAGDHKIIHIGTHAAYDNVHPEQSGLVFAKNVSATNEPNFISLYDLYNCNVRSELTLLTACESGRPGYQDGEGMVSLAHAFNYAGSERILTALWKIDEQSSNQITGYFVEQLQKGETTDVALRNAKLRYLQQAEGRTLAPAYWAGLIMMGEPGVIHLESRKDHKYWIVGGAIALAAIILLFFKLNNRKPHVTLA